MIIFIPLRVTTLVENLESWREQGCSGARTRRNAVPANIFEPERRSGKYCLSHPELILQRSGKSARTIKKVTLYMKFGQSCCQENH